MVALRVVRTVRRNGPASGVNDILESIQGAPVQDTSDVPRRLAYLGCLGQGGLSWCGARGVDVPVTVIVGEAARGIAISYQYLVGVGLPRHRAVCLFSARQRLQGPPFLHLLPGFLRRLSFHYTGKLNGFDQVIYWGNLVAGWLAPALFLHFCLTFPEPRLWYRQWVAPLIYAAGRHPDAGRASPLLPAAVARGYLGASKFARRWTGRGSGCSPSPIC